MSGKWDWLRSKFPKLQPESTYQDKVEQILNAIIECPCPHTKLGRGDSLEVDKHEPGCRGDKPLRKLPTAEVETLYNKVRKGKEDLDAQLSKANLELEALTQLIVERYEDDGVTSKKLKDGTSLGVSVEPYPTVIPEKKDEFLAWVKAEGMESLLSLNYQTMAKIVKARLESGQLLPPGIDVFCRNKLTRRGGKKEES
jgi:hypothetical protein